jgi:hypothetical protein
MRWPSSSTVPLNTTPSGKVPQTADSRLDLPEPLAPITVWMAPAGTSIDKLRTKVDATVESDWTSIRRLMLSGGWQVVWAGQCKFALAHSW